MFFESFANIDIVILASDKINMKMSWGREYWMRRGHRVNE